jgi:DNA-binding CsgD family transcriptional regulator
LLSAVETIYGISSLAQYPSGIYSALKEILPCDTMCYNEIALPDLLKSWIMEPAEALPGRLLKESFLRHYTEHPVFLHYTRSGDLNSYRISDFLSRQQFHNSTLYNEYYRKASVEYQLATCFLLSPKLMVGITLDRHCTDFSEEDRLFLDLLRPHLVQAYYNVEKLELMKGIIGTGGKELLFVSRTGQVGLASDDAWRMISKYFNVKHFRHYLPDVLNSWIVHERARLDDIDDVPSTLAPLVVSKDNQKLIISFLWGGRSAGQDIILIEEESELITTGLLVGTQLTDREYDILAFLSQGKTNSEIGQALSISPLTVKKHLEHIYSKLGVHSRSAAVARFYQQ